MPENTSPGDTPAGSDTGRPRGPFPVGHFLDERTEKNHPLRHEGVLPTNTHVCKKCEKVKELRDKVPGGAEMAQLVSKDIDQWQNSCKQRRVEPCQ